MSGSRGDGNTGIMRLKRLSLLTIGHFASDFYPGMLSPLLPLILDRYGLSLAEAGILVMVLQIFSHLSQPFVGILNDHRPMKSFLWVGLIISGLPFCFLLQFNRLVIMIILLAVSGIGVGMYHPVAAVSAGLTANEDQKGVSMALFSSGGIMGFIVAPLIVVIIVEIIGEKYMPLVVLPALIAAFFFVFDREIVVSEGHQQSISEWFSALFGSGRELFILWLISSFRAVALTVIISFLPLLAIARGASSATSLYFLSGSLFAGMVGMFIGGHLSDLHGRRKVMAITLFIASPILYGFLYTSGIVSTMLLLLGMGALFSTIPLNIILAQRAAPKQAGMASSLVMGLSFALAAVGPPLFGTLADRVGIEVAMNVVFIIPVIGSLSVFLLRKE